MTGLLCLLVQFSCHTFCPFRVFLWYFFVLGRPWSRLVKEIDYDDFCFKFFRCFCDTFWWVGCDLDKCRKLTREHSLSSWLTWSIRDHLLRHRPHHPHFHHLSSPIIAFVIITTHRLPTLCRCDRFHTSSKDREQLKTRVQRPTCWEGDKILMAAQKNNISICSSVIVYLTRKIINTLEVPS